MLTGRQFEGFVLFWASSRHSCWRALECDSAVVLLSVYLNASPHPNDPQLQLNRLQCSTQPSTQLSTNKYCLSQHCLVGSACVVIVQHGIPLLSPFQHSQAWYLCRMRVCVRYMPVASQCKNRCVHSYARMCCRHRKCATTLLEFVLTCAPLTGPCSLQLTHTKPRDVLNATDAQRDDATTVMQ